jgi:ABC-type bacteriocin/lantibiotic exporter with double-glycine peptidase domain
MIFFNPLHNCEQTAIRLIKKQHINITDSTIKKFLQTHPDYPSLLSILDFLNSYNIETLALKVKAETLVELPVPFIAQIKNPETGEQIFTLVHNVKNNTITYEDVNKQKLIQENIEQFKQKFTGHTLSINSDEAVPEKDYDNKRLKEKAKNYANVIALFLLPTIVLCYIVGLFATQPFSTIIFSVLFLLLSLVGAAVSFLLLLFEIDNHNPLLKEICQ